MALATHDSAVASEPETPRRRRISLSWALGLGAGAIALLGVLGAGLAILGGIDASVRLLRQQGLTTLDRTISRITLHLQPAEAMIGFLAERLQTGEVDAKDVAGLTHALIGALAAAPQVGAVSYIDAHLFGIGAVRQGGSVVTRGFNASATPEGENRYLETLSQEGPFWGDLAWSPVLHVPVLNVRQRVRQGEVVSAVVTLTELSRLVSYLGDGPDQRAFILVDRSHVLAHPALVDRWSDFAAVKRLPRIDEIGDPVLAAIWERQSRSYIGDRVLEGGIGHRVQVDGVPYIFVYREFLGYGQQTWIVGQYLPLSDIMPLTRSLFLGAGGAAFILAIAVVLAFLLGRWIGAPVTRLGEAASRMRDLDFDVEDLPRSPFTELDDAARAFNASRAALRWFSMYVPRKLVTRLLADGEASMVSRRRNVTVMFTDIVGFTAMAEDQGEAETADLLNSHFAMLAQCIDEENGVIDKFMGDAIMASWGAIKRTDEHAAQACRAALAIASSIERDNAMRIARGLPPVRLRIGLHSGPVVVGNIGSPGRINFTVVGDTVNAAQRLEVLGKEFMTEQDQVIVLCSEATHRAAGPAIGGVPVGDRQLTGREGMVTVWRLK